MELLVSIGIAAVVLTVLASAMRSQGRSALFQIGTADMQQNVRGALDVFRAELRMAGYGMTSVEPDVLAPLELPALGTDLYAVTLRGNYLNVQSRGSAVAGSSTITLDAGLAAELTADGLTFLPGERVAIQSAILGLAEVRVINGYNAGAGTLTVSAALVNEYETGSVVTQITELAYRLDSDNLLWRNAQLVADQIDLLDLVYVLDDGTEVLDPTAELERLRSATIGMHSEMPEHDGMKPEAGMNTHVRIRNLGLIREPAVGL
jgi:Tfp pilus assembly protein PilW